MLFSLCVHPAKVWLREFPFLKFRALQQHPECSTCVRHKALIQNLGRHVNARKAQQEAYFAHLHSQYLDRLEYWSHRGASRLRSSELTLICDGMDQSKFFYPMGSIPEGKGVREFHETEGTCHRVPPAWPCSAFRCDWARFTKGCINSHRVPRVFLNQTGTTGGPAQGPRGAAPVRQYYTWV